MNHEPMKLFPSTAHVQLEFDKIKALLAAYCQTNYAHAKAGGLIIHTEREKVETALRQTQEYRQLMRQAVHFPNDHILNLEKELKLLGIPGAVLTGEQILLIRQLAESIERIFRWFDPERMVVYNAMAKAISDTYYEKGIQEMIDFVLDEYGQVKDNASADLKNIRLDLYRKRNELRRLFDRIVSKLNKQGFLAEIEESFMNGRKVLAVFAEQKRAVKGILHGESDSRKTAFVEPEETIELNNLISGLEFDEKKEVYRILRELMSKLSPYSSLLDHWHTVLGEFDFIRARAKLAADINGEFPLLSDQSQIQLVQAYHPLLFLYNQRLKKPTIPVTINLDGSQRILVISGPNAGG